MFARTTNQRGFTLIELLISMVVGLTVLASAMSFAMSTYRTVGSSQVREETYRSARFITMSLERDFQSTGVGIESTIAFGSLTVYGDTIVIFRVPYNPTEAAPYDLDPPAGTDNPLPSGGTCGSRCITLAKVGGDFDIEVGDVARLQVNSERRLILVQSLTDNGANVELWFTNATQLLGYTAGLTGDLRLDRFGTFTQELAPVVYYMDGTQLKRAETLNPDGTPKGDVIADGVQSWQVKVQFEDGDVEDQPNPNDSDGTNDYNNIVSVLVNAQLAADRPNPHVNNGQLFTRDYEWHFSPRNLMYERNRR